MNTIEQLFEHLVYTHGLNTQQRLYSLTDHILSRDATIPWRRAAVTLHILEMSLNIGSNSNTLGLIDDMFLTSICPTKCAELHPVRTVIFRWLLRPPICVGLKIGVFGRVGLVCAICCVSAGVMELVGSWRFLWGKTQSLQYLVHKWSDGWYTADHDDDPSFCRGPDEETWLSICWKYDS